MIRRHLLANVDRLRFSRTYLSEAYACNDVWQARLRQKPFVDLDSEKFLFNLRRQLQAKKVGNPIDIDVAFNFAKSSALLEELKVYLYNIRHSKLAASLLPSTHHAFVRACLATGSDQLLLHVMADPINYGIFPDAFVSNLAVDHFLKANKMAEAAKLSCDMMKQEEFRPSVCWLSVLSCLKWALSAKQLQWPAELVATQSPEDHLKEDVIFRVPFLKNPIEDGHFDLQQARLLVGKTLAWMSEPIANAGVGVRSVRVLGLCLWNQSGQLGVEVAALRRDGLKICSNTPDILKTLSEEADDGQAVNCLTDDLLVESLLEEEFKKEMDNIWPELEKQDIEEQRKLYDHWNRLRSDLMDAQVKVHSLKRRLLEIEEHERALSEQEDFYTFFEKKSHWEQEALKKFQIDAEATGKSADIPPDDLYVVPELKRAASQQKKNVY